MSLALKKRTFAKGSSVLEASNPIFGLSGDDMEHAGETGEEPWLVSYADLMTLLFGFFAMLFTYASFDDDTSVRVSKQVAKYFGGTYVSSAQKIGDQVKFEWMKSPYGSDMDMKVGEDGMEITFITSVLFTPGRAELLPEAILPVKTLIKVIQDSEKDSQIRVEGHTDDNAISNSTFPSNWELSAARAGTIVRMFQQEGFRENQLSIAGYGSSRPAYPNRDENGQKIDENQSHNRRVVVKVILPKGQKKNQVIDVNSSAADRVPGSLDSALIPSNSGQKGKTP
jgi:chemotaxis protein MotB